MRWVAMALCYGGLLSLCLAMPKHYRQLLHRNSSSTVRIAWTIAGWGGLAASLAAAISADGWAFGTVAWVSQLAVIGLLLVLMLPHMPRFALAVGVLSLGSVLTRLLLLLH